MVSGKAGLNSRLHARVIMILSERIILHGQEIQ